VTGTGDGAGIGPAEASPPETGTATAPSAGGHVVLELGPGVGALVLYAPADLEGAEIEIGPATDRRDGQAARRTHARVRRRQTVGSASYAAVYQGLAAGTYVIWSDPDTPAGTVGICGGRATSWSWPVASSASPSPASDRPVHSAFP